MGAAGGPPRAPLRKAAAAQTAGPRGSHPALIAQPAQDPIAALAVAYDAQRAQEVDPAEVGPVDVAEVELRVRALPEQEAGEPLLAAGADDQVGIGLARGVEVLGDVVDVEDLGELLERAAGSACSCSSERTASAISRRPP